MTGPEGMQQMEQDTSLDSLPSLDPQMVPDNADVQPMEGVEGVVSVAEGTPAVVAEDPLTGSYTWTMRDYPNQMNRVESESFEAGGYPWRLLCFPHGNNTSNMLSLYLMADGEDAPLGWTRSAHFTLSLLNHKDPARSFHKEAQHNFHAQEIDWGFTKYAEIATIRDPEMGFLQDDSLTFKVDVRVSSPDDSGGYDSKRETGYVGLKNQGATCYMNSLLQTLYNINLFRKAVYHMPTSEEESPSANMPLALQSVFYKLQFGRTPVSTKDLTQSFGWDSSDAFQQHDVQELNRILCDRLEEKMKGTRVEGKINQLFEGQTVNYIQCINVDYKSSRRESFMDIQLDVKGCRNVYDSFAKYCEVETLEGENQYNAEGHGMQDARKGVLFESFPPVLQLQLKRFEYDFMKDTMVKINDRYEFYDELDLDRGGERPYLSPDADRNTHNAYRLLAVLVHSGGVHGGHYYAYIRPDGQQWLKFDDEKVEKADPQKAIEENWGGEGERPPPGGLAPYKFTKFANAYMLVYVRVSDWDSIMCPVAEDDISDHVCARLKAEQEEKERRKREKMEAHLYTMVRVSTDADLREQIGSSRFFDLVDHDKVKAFKLSKRAPFSEVRRLVAEELGVPPQQQRYWRWALRQNTTYRPGAVLEVEREDAPVSSLAETKRQVQRGAMSSINLFLEAPLAPGAQLPARNPKTDILLFLKMYTPGGGGGGQGPHIQYVGRVFAHKNSKVQELFPIMTRLAGLPEDTPLDVYEEVKFEPSVMVDVLRPATTLHACQLEDGDILILQPRETVEDARRQGLPYPTACDYLMYVRFRHLVKFKRLDAPNDEGLELELRADMDYDKVSAALAQKLGLDHPLKLRFTGQNAYSGMPRPTPIRYKTCATLEDMVKAGHYGQVLTLCDVLFYKVLDLPLPEFEKLMNFKISFHNSKLEEGPVIPLRLPRDSSVAALLEALRAQLPQEAHEGRPLRLMEIYQWKIWQVYDPSARVETISENPWHLRAEVVPEGEEGLDDPQAMHVHCLQISRDGNQKAFAFSDPFLMGISEGETVGDLRQRVQQKLEIPDEEFEKWGVFLCSAFSTPEPLADDVVISQRIPSTDLHKLYTHSERACIGFEHENKNPRRTHAHINRNNSFYGQERQLKIKA